MPRSIGPVRSAYEGLARRAPEPSPPAPADGRIAADDDLGRERLVRYCSRAPFALERIKVLRHGRIAYLLEVPREGRTHRIMTPMALMARLAALIPASSTRLRDYISPYLLATIRRDIPDYGAFVMGSSPASRVDELTKPLFLFHAHDDEAVKFAKTASFAGEMKRRNPAVTFVVVPEGGHYKSMLHVGIPRAIDWLQRLP